MDVLVTATVTQKQKTITRLDFWQWRPHSLLSDVRLNKAIAVAEGTFTVLVRPSVQTFWSGIRLELQLKTFPH